MAVCPSCGGYMPRSSKNGICRECLLKREIDAYRDLSTNLYRKLPFDVRARFSSKNRVYTRQSGYRSTNKRLKRLYLERDALIKQYESYRNAAIECGVIKGDK